MSVTPSFAVTFFASDKATRKTEETMTLGNLAERIRAATAPRKDMLPWLKLARFGNKRTDKNSLRHDANVLACSGIEGDYDGERVTVERACEALLQQGIAAIVYTSPSHTEDAARWRVLCPLSAEQPPARRNHQLGRLNGLLRGILAHESWTLSQSYYYGAVSRNPSHRVEVIDGTPIDQHDDLDTIWLGKPGASKDAAAAGQHVNAETREDAELIRCIVTGEHLHVELCALAARYVGRGVPAETVEGLLRGIMLSYPESARDERWSDRHHSIPDLVASAVRKYRDEAQPRKPDQRRSEIAREAFRLLRRGIPSDAVLTTLHQINEQRSDPLPRDTIGETALWAARRMKEQTDAR